MIAALFFIWFLVSCLWTINALRRPVPPGKWFPPLWLPGMIVSELAPWLMVFRPMVALIFYTFGGTATTIGQLGFWLFLLSELGLLVIIARSLQSARATGADISPWTLFKIWDRLPQGVEVTPEVHYWNGLTLDVYRHGELESNPTLIYVHPGSWMRGRPGRQARSLFHRLAAEGWTILDIRYPLSPQATFPEHLIGVKRAIAWARNDGAVFGVNPKQIAIAGGSSGAHLAALAALTWDRPDLQPGFEGADTSVVACTAFYGIYDLLVRNPTRYDWPFVARYVMKARPSDAPDLYELGSPVDQVRDDAPPFHVIHGEFDSIVLPSESRHFVESIRQAGGEVTYHEVRGAQHGFDAIASLRTRSVGQMCATWLAQVAARI